jgi:monothiol bacilliredoxin
MHWIHLTENDQLEQVVVRSQERPQVIFKHSTRCSTSSVVLARLQRMGCQRDVDFYFLDLVTYREISEQVEEVFHVRHESPQILMIRNGECRYKESHLGINPDDLLATIQGPGPAIVKA